MPHVEAKRMRALAVTSLQPWPQLPGLPTLAQSVPGYEVMSFNGVGGARATPPARIIGHKHASDPVLDQPDIRKRLVEQGNEVRLTTPEDMTRKVNSEIAKWRNIAETRKLDLQDR